MYCLISVALSQPLRTGAEKEPKEVWTFNAELRTGIFTLSTVDGPGYVEAQIPALTPHSIVRVAKFGDERFRLVLATRICIADQHQKPGSNSSPFA